MASDKCGGSKWDPDSTTVSASEFYKLRCDTERQLNDLWRQVEVLTGEIQTLQMQVESMMARTEVLRVMEGGELVWRISEIKKKVEATKKGEISFITCEPFLTSQFGYKVSLQLYLNGVSKVNGKYISLYVRIMEGDHDDLLSWPFSPSVTLTLLSQDGMMEFDLTQRLFPSVFPSYYARPRTKMNQGFGFNRFVPIDVLEHPLYVVNDTMYIKVIIHDRVRLPDIH